MVDGERRDLSENPPEVSRIEAELAQLQPRREARFADELKNRMKDELTGKSAPSESVTATVKVPLTHYIRIAQFNAAVGGLLAGLFLGVILGGAAVLVIVSRLDIPSPRPGPFNASASYPTPWGDSPSLTPLERTLLEQLEKEQRHGPRQAEFRFRQRERLAGDRS